MAVWSNIYGAGKTEYVGCVLDTWEHNGYEDSDWYALCWDEEKQSVVEVEYDTTRCGGGGRADIDITEENLRKVYRCYRNEARREFDTRYNESAAKEIRRGDEVEVVRGRKVPKKTRGKVFWVGKRFNYYSYREEERVGIEANGEKVFLPLEYVEVVNWRDRLVTGKQRKQMIRNYAINKLPAHCRKYFICA